MTVDSDGASCQYIGLANLSHTLVLCSTRFVSNKKVFDKKVVLVFVRKKEVLALALKCYENLKRIFKLN